MDRMTLIATVLVLAPGCYLKPLHATNPPPSAEGVRVTLIGDDCADHQGTDGDPVSRDLGVKIKFDNPTDHTLRIAESAVRLIVDDDGAGVKGAGVEAVAPHSSRTIVLDFTHHKLCNSETQFKIAWNGALTLGDQPITVAALTFSP
jgi:hypothetical protein